MSNPSFTGNITKYNPELDLVKIEPFDDVIICAQTKKINELGFADKVALWFQSHVFQQEFVQIEINGDPLLIRIQDVAESLDISRKKILKSEKEHTLKDLIQLAVEAKHYHLPYSFLREAQEQGNIEELRYLAYLAESHHLPIQNLLEAKQNGNLQEVLYHAQELESKVQAVCDKLDALYSEVEGKLATKNAKGSILAHMNLEEFRAIKSVVRMAFKILAKNPQGIAEAEVVIPLTKHHYAIARSSGDSLQIVGLFGKLIGYGAHGAAAQRLNIMEAQFETRDEAVVKIPMSSDAKSAQIIHEASILNKIHQNKQVLGIQKWLRLIKNVFAGTAKHCHLGDLYQKDLEHVLTNQTNLTKFEKFSLAFQLAHGVSHMHKLEVTHGDIKPPNIFCNFDNHENRDETKTRLFLSDFGGAIDHQASNVPFQDVVSNLYRMKQDDVASNKAHTQKDLAKYKEVEKKADVFALSSVICSILINQIPYSGEPSDPKSFQIKSELSKELKNIGASQATQDLLMRGLSTSYQDRPTAVEIMEAIKADFVSQDPDKAAILLQLAN